jgi:NADH-quinone oxidoreductase subunit M
VSLVLSHLLPSSLSLLLCVPAIGALAVLLSGAHDRLARALAMVTSLAALLLSLPLWLRFQPRGAEWQFAKTIELLPMAGISYAVGLDGFALSLVVLTALLGFAAALAISGMEGRPAQLLAAILLLETGALGAFMSLDLVQLVVFWLVAMLGASASIGLTAGRRAGLVSSAVSVATSVAMLAAILALHGHYRHLSGTRSFNLRIFQGLAVPEALQTPVFGTLLVACALPIGLFMWIVRSHDTARREMRGPALVVLALMSAVLVKLGTYCCIRLGLSILPEASRFLSTTMVLLAVAGAIGGAVAALRQTDLARCVAYTSVSQLALVFLGTFALTPDGLTGSLAHQVTQGVSTGALLIALAFIVDRSSTAQSADLAGLARAMPYSVLVILVAALSLAAVPAFAGFFSVRTLAAGVWPVNRVAIIVAVLAVVAGGVRILWLSSKMMLRDDGRAMASAANGWEAIVLTPLAAAIIWIGLQPAPLLSRLETSVARVVLRVSPQYAPQVTDCLSQAPPPDPAETGLPAGMVMAAPCADGATQPHDSPKR